MAIHKARWTAGNAFHSKMVHIAGKVAIGSSGAVGAQTGLGFSVARTGAGRYTVTLDAVGTVKILAARANVVTDGVAGSGAFVRTIVDASHLFTLQTEALATPGTPADPANGSTLVIEAIVQNSDSIY